MNIGHPFEEPNCHLSNFLELCRTIKMNRVDHDVINTISFLFEGKKQRIGSTPTIRSRHGEI